MVLALSSQVLKSVVRCITEGNKFACRQNGSLGFAAPPGRNTVAGLGISDFQKPLAAFFPIPQTCDLRMKEAWTIWQFAVPWIHIGPETVEASDITAKEPRCRLRAHVSTICV